MARTRLLALVALGLLLLQGLSAYNLAVLEARWDPFDRTLEFLMQEPPICLISRWCSTGGDPEFPCTKITVTTCPEDGETPEQLKARHKAAVQAQLAIWPQDCEDCE